MQPSPAFSLAGLFLQADPVVKGVMLLLLAASVGVWTVVIDKAMRFGRLRQEARALDTLSRNQTIGSARDGFASEVLRAGLTARGELGDETRAERRERLREAMRMVLADRLRPLEPGLPFLATVGSAAPFIGLFGTVWGIMNSFASIASANDTSLAVVAPGIAEALLSTAIGLAAAIPAVVAYNRLVTRSRPQPGSCFGGDRPSGRPAQRRRARCVASSGGVTGVAMRFPIGDDEDADMAPMADINVTPMVDVMLVLLIIFMVAAPLMMSGVPLHLPKTAAAQINKPHDPIILSIDRDGHVFVGSDLVAPDAVAGPAESLGAVWTRRGRLCPRRPCAGLWPGHGNHGPGVGGGFLAGVAAGRADTSAAVIVLSTSATGSRLQGRVAFATALVAHAAALAALVMLSCRPPPQPVATLTLEAPPPAVSAATAPAAPAAQTSAEPLAQASAPPPPASTPTPDAARSPAPDQVTPPPPLPAPTVEPVQASPVLVAPSPDPAPPPAVPPADTVPMPPEPSPVAAPVAVAPPEPPAPPPPVVRRVEPPKPRPAPRPRPAVAQPRRTVPTRPADERTTEPAQTETRPSASVSAAAPVARVPSPAAAAPAATIGADWRASLAAWLQAHRHYPDQARQRGDEGRTVIRFTVARDGRVLGYTLVSSSGSASLDEAAEAMFRNAQLPPFPASMAESQVTVTVPIRFRLEE